MYGRGVEDCPYSALASVVALVIASARNRP